MKNFLLRVQDLMSSTLGISPSTFDKLVLTLVVFIAAVLIRRLIGRAIDRRVQELSRQYILRKTFSYVTGFVLVTLWLRIWLGGVTGLAASTAGTAAPTPTSFTNS